MNEIPILKVSAWLAMFSTSSVDSRKGCWKKCRVYVFTVSLSNFLNSLPLKTWNHFSVWMIGGWMNCWTVAAFGCIVPDWCLDWKPNNTERKNKKKKTFKVCCTAAAANCDPCSAKRLIYSKFIILIFWNPTDRLLLELFKSKLVWERQKKNSAWNK